MGFRLFRQTKARGITANDSSRHLSGFFSTQSARATQYLDLSLLEQRFDDAAVTLRQTCVVDADAKCQGVLQGLVPAMQNKAVALRSSCD